MQVLRPRMSPLARRLHMSDEAQDLRESATAVSPPPSHILDCALPTPWARDDALFDAHLRLFDFFQVAGLSHLRCGALAPEFLKGTRARCLPFPRQHSEGIGVLLETMDRAGVGAAALTGRPLKKAWTGREERRAQDPFADDDPLYYFSLTDTYVMEAVRQLPPRDAERLVPLACGFDPRDRSSSEQIESLFQHYTGWRGLGELILRDADVLSLAPKPRPAVQSTAFHAILQAAAKHRVSEICMLGCPRSF